MTDIPLALIDASPFESRETIDPLETAGAIIQPIVVRPKGSRFEIVAGHRRFATYKFRGATEAPCRIIELSDEEAARALFSENRDRRDFTDFDRGLYFKRFMESFGFTEREAAAKLGISDTLIDLSLGVAQARARVLRPLSNDTRLYERTMTATKYSTVNSLPEGQKAAALSAVVAEKLSTNETRALVSEVERGKSVDAAVVEVVNARETGKPIQAQLRNGAGTSCRVCGNVTLLHNSDGTHELLGDGSQK